MRNKLLVIFVAGVVARLLLAATTYHSDIQPFYFAGTVIAKGNIVNFYDYLGGLPKDSEILRIFPTYLFNYPPLVYFFLGPLSYLLSLSFSPAVLRGFIFDLPKTLGNVELNFLLLTLKLPFLSFDLATGYLLYKMFDEPKKKLLAFGLWMVNPINLFATYMMGQFDIIPTFFVVLALYLVTKKTVAKGGLLLEGFLLGLGASFKIFPFLLLVPLALVKPRWTDRMKTVGVAFLTYLATIAAFLNSPGFRATALVAGQTTKSLYAKIDISGGEALMLFPVVILFFYLVSLNSVNLKGQLWQKFFIVLLLFFVFTHYHPQWLVWLTPFLVIDLVETNFSNWAAFGLILLSWFGLLTLFAPGLTTWLFAPVFPTLYGMKSVWELLGVSVDTTFGRSVLQSVFAAAAFYYICRYFPTAKGEHEKA